MKKITLSVLLKAFLFLTAINVSAQSFEWARRAGYYAFDYGYGVCADAKGNIYVSGKFEMDAIFDDTTVFITNNHDIFTAKYNSAGKIQWVRTAGGTWGDYAHAVTCDDEGNTYVTGEIEMTTEFYGSGIKVESWGGNDIFIAKYNTHGVLQWVRRAGGSGSDRGYAIVVRGNDLYVSGSFNNTAWFEDDKSVALTSAGGHDIYLAKYDINGNLKWVRRGGGPNEDRCFGLAVDTAGDIYITGFYNDEAEFNGTTYQSNGTADMFLVKYGPNGDFKWFKTAGGQRNDMGTALAAGKDGKIYVTGGFREKSYFGNHEIWAKKGDTDIFIACYDKDGNCIWVKKAGGDINDRGNGIVVDDTLNVYVTGYYGFDAEFGEGSNKVTITAADSADIFVAKYNKDGDFKWVLKVGGQKDAPYQMGTEESGRDLWMDKGGNLIVTGSFRTDAQFGSTYLQGWEHSDIFVAKIKQAGSKDLSVSEQPPLLENMFEVYPNPARGKFRLVYYGDSHSDVTVMIKSIDGRLIEQRSIDAGGAFNEVFDIRNVQAGIYFVQISTKEGSIVKKVVMQ
jgi:hypothetical protein